MALLLLLETSSPVGSVSVSLNENVIGTVNLPEQNSHARILTTAISEVVHLSGYKLSDLDAIAYSAGPGSYTGLRIGLSTAKGLAYILEKPLIAVPTLRALCESINDKLKEESIYALPMLDARRQDVYMAFFDNSLNEISPANMLTVNEAFLETFSGFRKIIAFGSGAFKLKKLTHGSQFEIIDDVLCRSEYLAPFAFRKFVEQNFENMPIAEPVYLNQMSK